MPGEFASQGKFRGKCAAVVFVGVIDGMTEAVYSSLMETKPMIFREPTDLLVECAEERASIPDVDFFLDSRHKPLQEKYCAAIFGVGYAKYVGTCRVALNESRYRRDADFFLEAKGLVFPFQTTERQREGRKRGDEYRRRAEVERMIAREPEREMELLLSIGTPYRPALGSEKGPEWIKGAIARKARKRYAGGRELNLLVYANFEVRDLDTRVIREMVDAHRDEFASIWITTNRHICTLFSNERIGEVPEGRWGVILGDERGLQDR